MGRLQELIQTRLGIETEVRSSAPGVQVGVAVVSILRNDPDRVAAVIVNLSANTIFVAPDRAVSATRGIRLAPNGGSTGLTWDEDFDSTGWEWFAVADAAASDVFVLEVVGL